MDTTNISYIGIDETDLTEDSKNDNINNYINRITIDCLVNKNIVNRNKNDNNTNIDEETLLNIKFYRKRIYSLVKLLSTSENIRSIHPDIFSAFITFSKTLINHFETVDKNTIIQNYHKEEADNENNTEEENEKEKEKEETQYTMNDDDNIKKGNILLFNKKNEELHNPTLDKFIIKPDQTRTPNINDISISASRREINLRNPKFRKKQF